tara:strand:+ start:2595 stop:3074 length:480 start_codon:yes stop_codon:yes gene_type:complete
MQILPIQENDFDEILRLNTAAVPHVNDIDREQLQWFCDKAAFPRCIKIDDRIAGFMIGMRPGTTYASPNYQWFCSNYEDFAYVDRVVVSDWARRQGVAELLYREFADSQSDTSIMTCEVNLRPPNEGSMKFHSRMGFKQVASQETDGGKKEVALMEKRS